MEKNDLEISLEAMFTAQMPLKGKGDVMELLANENKDFGDKMLALLVKPHDFRTLPIK